MAIPDDAVLLPEMLREAGFATGAVVSHDYCSSRLGFHQGYDRFDDSRIVQPHQVSSPHITRSALAFLDDHAGDRFFLLLHYFDPHFDYVAFPGCGPKPADAEPSRREFLEAHRRHQRGELDEDALADLLDHYDSEIAYTDHHLGRVFEHLRRLGLWDDTVVVVTADHGEEFLDHGHLGHGETLHAELLRVPLIVKHAGAGRRGVVAGTVGLVDVVPTVLTALGLPVPEGLDGEPLPGPGGEVRAGRVVFSETARPRGRLRRAAVGQEFKLVQRGGESGAPALYDLAADPSERHDVAARYPDRVQALSAAIERWSEPLEPVRGARPVELTPAERRRLKRLGYLRD